MRASARRRTRARRRASVKAKAGQAETVKAARGGLPRQACCPVENYKRRIPVGYEQTKAELRGGEGDYVVLFIAGEGVDWCRD